jgi:hypothetical protein
VMIIEWKSGKSGVGGVFDGDMTIASPADAQVFDNYVKDMRNQDVCSISYHYRHIF